MAEQATEQTNLFGSVDTRHGALHVSNSDLYPYMQAIAAIASECRLHYADGSFTAKITDPANVAMVEASLSGVDDLGTSFTLGFPCDEFAGTLQNKPRDSDITVELGDPVTTVTATDTYASGQEWSFTHAVNTIDPEVVRESADIPDLDLSATAKVAVNPLLSYLRNSDGDGPIRIHSDGETLRIGESHGGDYNSVAEITDGANLSGAADSMYSADYVIDIVDALYQIGAETVTFEWDDEHPIFIRFEAGNISGRYCLAPRIQS